MKKKILIESEYILLDAETASISPIFTKDGSSIEKYGIEDFRSIKSNLRLDIEDKKQLEKALEELENSKITIFYFSVKDMDVSFSQNYKTREEANNNWLRIAKLIKEANETSK